MEDSSSVEQSPFALKGGAITFTRVLTLEVTDGPISGPVNVHPEIAQKSEDNGDPFTVNPLVAFQTGALCVVPVNVLEAFNLGRLAESARFALDICDPFT